MRNNQSKVRFFGEIQKLKNGRYKIAKMQKLVGVNQHRRKWRDIDTTQFAKELNSHLIIN